MTVTGAQDRFQFRLLNEFQRDFPVVRKPFARLAEKLSTSESHVIAALAGLSADGSIARVGAAVRPNTAGASTLAALSVPPHRTDAVVDYLAGIPGMNHCYLREDSWNLWIVATAPDEETLAATLREIAVGTGLRVLDLRLVRPFHIDLGFSLDGAGPKPRPAAGIDRSVLRASDKALLQILSDGIPLVPEPYQEIAVRLDRPEAEVMQRIDALCAAGVISRFGIIVRHRRLGWNANAMVVWDVPAAGIEAAGEALARLPGVSLCYQRRTEPDVWPYPLYIMVHGRSRGEALEVVAEAAALPQLAGIAHKVLFSTHCFKQTGAWLHRQGVAV